MKAHRLFFYLAIIFILFSGYKTAVAKQTYSINTHFYNWATTFTEYENKIKKFNFIRDHAWWRGLEETNYINEEEWDGAQWSYPYYELTIKNCNQTIPSYQSGYDELVKKFQDTDSPELLMILDVNNKNLNPDPDNPDANHITYEQYYDYVSHVVERYDGDGYKDMPGLIRPVNYFEICNEVDLSNHNEKLTLQNYVNKRLIPAYLAAKHANPNAIVLNSGLGMSGDEGFSTSYLNNMLNLLKTNNGETNNYYIDVLAIHYYYDSQDPEYFDEKINEVKSLMELYNIASKPIWVTEFGIATKTDKGGEIREEDQASILLRFVSLMKVHDIQNFFIYQLKDENSNDPTDHENVFGIYKVGCQEESEIINEKLAVITLDTFLSKIDGLNVESIERNQGIYKIIFSNSNKKVQIAWYTAFDDTGINPDHSGETTTMTVSIGENTGILSDMYGKIIDSNLADGATITIGEKPHYIEYFTGSISNIDTALIIDSSGSMSWNDPKNLRKEAAEIFVGVAQNEDQIAIIDFDSYMKTLWHLQPLTENRDGIIAAINSIDSSGGTNIGRGLLGGYYELLSSSEPNSRAAVLLTDGDGSYYGEAELFKTEGWPIHTIGLGSSANSALLKNIADETGGIYFPLNDANQLKNVYFEIATHITGGTSIFGKNLYMLTGDFYELLVNVPLYQQMVTFLISWPGSDVSTTLVTPSGRQITPDTIDTDVYHAKGLTYELYRINNPEPGEWAVGLTGVDLSPDGEEVSVSASSVGPAAPVDTTPPIISISNPVNGKTYFDQLPTNFSFMIDDPESAIVSQSVLLNGVLINNNDDILLTQLGENTLTIRAINEANLTSELSIIFYVNHFTWLPPIKYEKGSATQTLTYIAQANSTLPIKFAIFNTDDSFIADTSVKVIVEGTTAQFLNGEGDTNIRINQEEGEDPLYIVNLHTNFNKCDYGLEAGNEYWLAVYFDNILAAKAKMKIE